jgi:hypothetical protein
MQGWADYLDTLRTRGVALRSGRRAMGRLVCERGDHVLLRDRVRLESILPDRGILTALGPVHPPTEQRRQVFAFSRSKFAVTFAEVMENLRQYDQEPVGGQAPTIYVADPWAPSSQATVEWSGEKGGVPVHRKPILFHLTTVREALAFFGHEYDDLVSQREIEGMCRKLAHHIGMRNAQRIRSDR